MKYLNSKVIKTEKMPGSGENCFANNSKNQSIMNKSILFFIALLLGLAAFAQAPLSFSYQAVARDLSGNVLANKAVSFRVTILSGSITGTPVYSETHSGVTTDEFGLVQLLIGNGTASLGAFSDIAWGDSTCFVKMEMDPEGDTAWQEIGTSQLMSVPYALFANSVKDGVSRAELEELKSEIELLQNTILAGFIPVDADGNQYNTVRIGNQNWMAENLKTTRFNDGSSIRHVTDGAAWSTLNTPAYCWYDNDIANMDTYGALYNWYTVNTAKLCPKGWHFPTGPEWQILTNYLYMNGYGIEGSWEDIAKSVATKTNWNPSATPNTPGNDPASNNSSGFSGPPGGIRDRNGDFGEMGDYGYWWSLTTGSTANPYFFGLQYNATKTTLFPSDKKSGISVRCVRD